MTTPPANCGARVHTALGVAVCTNHALGHHDPDLNLSWPVGDAPFVTEPPAETQQDDEREALRRRINQLERLLLAEQDARDADARRSEVQQDDHLVFVLRRHRELTGSSLSWTCTCGDRSDYAEHIAALASRPSADTETLPGLVTYLQGRRRDCLRALRASTGDSDQTDYWRWQGHAELARQLLERLGAEIPQ